MRFIETRPSGKDRDVPVYVFSIGKDELMVLYDILNDAKKRTPKSIFTMPFVARLNDMRGKIIKLFKQEGIKYPDKRAEIQKEMMSRDNVF